MTAILVARTLSHRLGSYTAMRDRFVSAGHNSLPWDQPILHFNLRELFADRFPEYWIIFMEKQLPTQ
jgi:hypothetical protein